MLTVFSFGPKGAAIIGDTIVNILDSDETFAPHAPGNMAFFRFIELFLVPCITVLLIEDEFECSGPDAVAIMYDSADAGELLQPLDDHPELMNIRDGIVGDGNSDDDSDGGRDNNQPQDSEDENDNPFQLQSAAVQWPNTTVRTVTYLLSQLLTHFKNISGASNRTVVAQTADVSNVSCSGRMLIFCASNIQRQHATPASPTPALPSPPANSTWHQCGKVTAVIHHHL